MKNCDNTSFISEANKRLKNYQSFIKGKDEFEEFSRLNKILELSEGSLYHIISKSWLNAWEEYILWENAHPGVISNKDIIDEKEILKDPRAYKFYANVLIKPEAREKKDYEIISKAAYTFLEKRYEHDSTVLKRWCISLNDDGSGLHIELHLKRIKLLIVPDANPKINIINISRIETVANLKEKILAIMPDQATYSSRFWIADETINLSELMSSNKKVTIKGKILKENLMIEECEIAENDIIVLELKKNIEWILYHPDEICSYCKNSGILQNCSSCKLVKYCSRKCQVSDYPDHKHWCKAAKAKMKAKNSESSGLVGLQNLGNTCFINSILQCVLHTNLLKDYFISQQYIAHLNKDNPLGTKDAALAQAFADIMESVWIGTEDVISPWTFKKIISKFAPQFIGYGQQDAHELLTFLLAGLHEDLNQIKIKPYIEESDYASLQDEEASSVAWNWFLARNKSFFVETMYGQTKSTLKCPTCNKTSKTFDAYLTLSVNLPNSQKQTCKILLIFMDNKIIKQELELVSNSTILKCKQILLEKFKINNLTLCYYNKTNIQGICDDYYEISDYSNKTLIGFECASDIKNCQPIPLKYYVVQDGVKCPITFTRLIFFKYESTLKKLYKTIKQIIPGENKINIINTAGHSGIFNKKRLPCDFCGNTDCLNCPLTKSSTTMKEILSQMKNSEGPFMIEILLNSNNPFVDTCNDVLNAENYSENCFTNGQLTLRNCLEYTMRPEILDMHNEWFCPNCKSNVQALKTFQLYKAPKILIFNLIRFKSRGGIHSQKITEFIDFPIKGLDLDGLSLEKNPGLYDLFAICNHFGELGGGHYTSFIESKGKWYHMDDSKVTQVSDEDIVLSAAYILFYKLRD